MIAYGVTNSSTTHGGKVLADQSLGLANGLGWLTVGVGFSCPQCKQWAVFPSGDPSMTVNGKSVILVGAAATCGAVLLPAQSLFVKGASVENTITNSLANLPHELPDGEDYDLYFHLKNIKTGENLPNIPYRVTLEDDTFIEGVTNEMGHTRKIKSIKSQVATIEAPYYGNYSDSTSHSNTSNGSDTCRC